MTWDTALKRASTNLEAVPLPGAATLPALITAKDLQGTHFPPVSWVVRDLVPEGLTLLAGKPKLGKSWLALQMGLGVATGREVLGRPVEQGTVLYAAMEDNYRRLKSRLGKCAGQLAAWPEDLLLTTEWPRLDAGGLEAIDGWLGSHPLGAARHPRHPGHGASGREGQRQPVYRGLRRASRPARAGELDRRRDRLHPPRPEGGCGGPIRYGLRIDRSDRVLQTQRSSVHHSGWTCPLRARPRSRTSSNPQCHSIPIPAAGPTSGDLQTFIAARPARRSGRLSRLEGSRRKTSPSTPGSTTTSAPRPCNACPKAGKCRRAVTAGTG